MISLQTQPVQVAPVLTLGQALKTFLATTDCSEVTGAT